MAWLFGRKKVPKVPFPEGRPFDEKALKLPIRSSSDRIIEPQEVKAAAGIRPPPQPLSMPEWEQEDKNVELNIKLPPRPSMRAQNVEAKTEARQPMRAAGAGPLYIRMDVYQTVLESLDALKVKFTELGHVQKLLEESEYNEENSFAQLRRDVKSIHDKLLSVDKTIFKPQGD